MGDITINLEKTDGIYDIQPLIEPALNPLEITLLLILVLLFIAVTIYPLWVKFYSKKALAQRKIKNIYTQYSNNKITSHQAIYQLCKIFTEGLNIKNLNKRTKLPGKLIVKKQKWLNFVNNLSTLRYTNSKKENAEIKNAFVESLYWLRNWS